MRFYDFHGGGIALAGFLGWLWFVPGSVRAQGRMWTFEDPPLAYLKHEYGFEPGPGWFEQMKLASLRLGERDNPWCSASFVSPRGLIMTNHHCVRDQIAQVQGQNDWVADGFAATALADEVPIPGLTVQQLIAQEDVTALVERGIEASDDDSSAAGKREANIAAIIAAADRAHPGHLHQVVALYRGALHTLYRYRVYDDLRLVVAPHLMTAHYGGEADNFTYPRWSIDFAFLRAYVDDQPADTAAHYFRWRTHGPSEGELVFVPGNPASTNRQLTMRQLQLQRDLEYPMAIEQFANSIAILEPFKEQVPTLQTTLLSWQNSYKALQGMLAGLQNRDLMQRKQRQENNLRGRVSEDPELGRRFGDVWRKIDALVEQQRTLLPKVMFYQPAFSGVLHRGVLLAQSLDETVAEDRRSAAREQAVNYRVGASPLTIALQIDHYRRAMNWLPPNDPLIAALAGRHRTSSKIDWQQVDSAVRQSRLSHDEFVQTFADDGAIAVERWQQSNDFGVQVARTLWPLMREAERDQQRLNRALASQNARLGRVLLAVHGHGISSDATMTLRFSDGLVKGYPCNGSLAPWSTTFYGLYDRCASFQNRPPFDLPDPWLEHRQDIELSRRVCFASTNDIAGGNSGSCVVDRELRVVGLIFDGNIESLANDFYYTQEVARAVSVHTDAIVTALQRVYGMSRIVDELSEQVR